VEINVVGTGTGEPASRAIYTKIKAQAEHRPQAVGPRRGAGEHGGRLADGEEGLLHRYVPQMKNAALVKGAR